jgi:hypothetical protein
MCTILGRRSKWPSTVITPSAKMQLRVLSLSCLDSSGAVRVFQVTMTRLSRVFIRLRRRAATRDLKLVRRSSLPFLYRKMTKVRMLISLAGRQRRSLLRVSAKELPSYIWMMMRMMVKEVPQVLTRMAELISVHLGWAKSSRYSTSLKSSLSTKDSFSLAQASM